jgi:hypothetical protein
MQSQEVAGLVTPRSGRSSSLRRNRALGLPAAAPPPRILSTFHTQVAMCICASRMLHVCYLYVASLNDRFEYFKQHEIVIAVGFLFILQPMVINIFLHFLMLRMLTFDVMIVEF